MENIVVFYFVGFVLVLLAAFLFLSGDDLKDDVSLVNDEITIVPPTMCRSFACDVYGLVNKTDPRLEGNTVSQCCTEPAKSDDSSSLGGEGEDKGGLGGGIIALIVLLVLAFVIVVVFSTVRGLFSKIGEGGGAGENDVSPVDRPRQLSAIEEVDEVDQEDEEGRAAAARAAVVTAAAAMAATARAATATAAAEMDEEDEEYEEDEAEGMAAEAAAEDAGQTSTATPAEEAGPAEEAEEVPQTLHISQNIITNAMDNPVLAEYLVEPEPSMTSETASEGEEEEEIAI